MRPHPMVRVSVLVAFLAIASSVVLTYAANPLIEDAVAVPVSIVQSPTTEAVVSSQIATVEAPIVLQSTFSFPIADALTRVTKKTFGMEIHPATSPVPNDRFNGYHVGVDFETTEAEADIDVPIFAICDGELILKELANGYGGLAIQSCRVDDEIAQVLYGHLALQSINAEPGQLLRRGERIGVLGKGHSPETDGVRKHLHLGIHRGEKMDIRGYVPRASDRDAWMDALALLSK